MSENRYVLYLREEDKINIQRLKDHNIKIQVFLRVALKTAAQEFLRHGV